MGSNFALITKEKEFHFSEKAQLIVDLLNLQIIKLESNDDDEGRLDPIFEKYKAILVRPDKYVYGGVETTETISEMIESLSSEFSLKA